MSHYAPRLYTCGFCKTRTTFNRMDSGFGAAGKDLDYRPAHLRGPLLGNAVMECPRCHYAAQTIEKPVGLWWPPVFFLLHSPNYRSFDGLNPPEGSLEGAAIHMALLERAKGHALESAKAFLVAAWRRDDRANGVENTQARAYRLAALGALRSYHPTGVAEKERKILLQADLLRRTGQFERLLGDYEGLGEAPQESGGLTEGYHRALLAYQCERARKKDGGRHSAEEAILWYNGCHPDAPVPLMLEQAPEMQIG